MHTVFTNQTRNDTDNEHLDGIILRHPAVPAFETKKWYHITGVVVTTRKPFWKRRKIEL